MEIRCEDKDRKKNIFSKVKIFYNKDDREFVHSYIASLITTVEGLLLWHDDSETQSAFIIAAIHGQCVSKERAQWAEKIWDRAKDLIKTKE